MQKKIQLQGRGLCCWILFRIFFLSIMLDDYFIRLSTFL